MSRSVRTEANHALALAAQRAAAASLPLLVIFVVCDGYPGANERHFSFLLQGVQAVRASLDARGVPLRVLRCHGGGQEAAPRAVSRACRACLGC